LNGSNRNVFQPLNRFQAACHVSCGSGFPAATIEAESLSHKKTNSLADTVTLGDMAR
jgi:hypothetical protein